MVLVYDLLITILYRKKVVMKQMGRYYDVTDPFQ